eukprot:4307882-Amphidinium_carterae.1
MSLADGHLDFLLGPASKAARSSGVEQAAAVIREAEKDKRSFGRLASEVEEGYLGRGGRA